MNIANRLFAQKGYHFREAFLSLVKQNFGGAFEPLDFVADPAAATQRINKWVADQTRDRIRDLIPGGALDKTTRLVLANALYLKAPWASEFSQNATQSELFFVRGAPVDVPMMRKTDKNFGYADYLYISQIFHKTFIVVDEKGTVAALWAYASSRRVEAAPMREKRCQHASHSKKSGSCRAETVFVTL